MGENIFSALTTFFLWGMLKRVGKKAAAAAVAGSAAPTGAAGHLNPPHRPTKPLWLPRTRAQAAYELSSTTPRQERVEVMGE